jgi:heme oxygenase-like protein
VQPTSVSSLGEGERLRLKIEIALPELAGASRKLVTHPRISDLYPEFLSTLHGIVRAAVPLMEATLDRAQSMSGEDHVAAELAKYLPRHVVEETGHDEWLLQDLEVLGIDRSTVLARVPSPTVAALVGAQYYWVLHYHPVAVLGYLIPLESHPPTTALIEDLILKTGHDRRAFRTLMDHSELDPHHGEELNELLNRLPLSSEQSTMLGISALHTVHMSARAIDEMIRDFEEPVG